MAKRLFVGNLSYDTSNEDLRGFFSTVGACVSATVMVDRATGRSRGFGFVEMESDAAAREAIERLHDRELQGRRISVSEARERTGSPSGSPGPPQSSDFHEAPRSRAFGPDLPPARQRFRKEGGSRRGLRARKRSL